jgi:serine/threonine protein kinase
MNNTTAPRHERLGTSTQAQRAVAAFRAAWNSAPATESAFPRLEMVLEAIPRAERTACLRELLAIELAYRTKRGETPILDEYLSRFPDDAATIQAVFENCGTVPPQEVVPPVDETISAELPDCTAPPLIPTGNQPLKSGTEIGSYTILQLIGQGGMGSVYQAEHRLMRRKVALKVITASNLEHPGALARFHREALAVARLEHPNIVTAHDADQFGDVHFLVMQYVEGDDLATTVRKHGPLTVDVAMRCLMQAARGLEYAHQEGVVHRDIKPSNLMVARNGVVKILDMGLARLEQTLAEGASGDRNLTQAGNIMGTIDYMAPEQALDAKEADQRADIYSLGCTFYYLLTGQKMYSGDTTLKRIMAHRVSPNPTLCAAREDVPAWLEPIFQKMIAKNVADRYQSMTELLTDMAPYVASGLAGPEMDVSVPGRRSLSDEASRLRPAAALLVEVPHTEPGSRELASDQTKPNAATDTQVRAMVAERPLPTVQSTPAAQSSPTAQSNSAAQSNSVAQSTAFRRDEPAAHVSNVSWRATPNAKEATSRNVVPNATTRKRRHRLIRVAGFYFGLLGLLAALGAFIYLQPDGGTVEIESADTEVTAALNDKGIRVHDAKTGRELTLQPGRNDLKSGEYEIDMAELPSGIEVSKKSFRLKRGGSERLKITPTKTAN